MLDFENMSLPIIENSNEFLNEDINEIINDILNPASSQESSDLDAEDFLPERFKSFQRSRRGGYKVFTTKNIYNIISINKKKELVIGKCIKNRDCDAKIYLLVADRFIDQTPGKRSKLHETILDLSNLDIQSTENHKCTLDKTCLNEEIFSWMKNRISDTYIQLATPHLIKETVTRLAINNFGKDLVRRAEIKDMIAWNSNI